MENLSPFHCEAVISAYPTIALLLWLFTVHDVLDCLLWPLLLVRRGLDILTGKKSEE